MLAYNCSPSFNWAAKLSVAEMETFREELAKMGYKFQFITLAGFHALNTAMFELALAYKEKNGRLQRIARREFALQAKGFRAVKHQSFVGTGYFDAIQTRYREILLPQHWFYGSRAISLIRIKKKKVKSKNKV
jgi:isocitrate lyase